MDPHITQYTVYITDNYTGNIIIVKNVTETQFTFNTSQACSCPMYQVSAWNAGGEGELSEKLQRCIPHSKLYTFIHLPNKDTERDHLIKLAFVLSH